MEHRCVVVGMTCNQNPQSYTFHGEETGGLSERKLEGVWPHAPYVVRTRTHLLAVPLQGDSFWFLRVSGKRYFSPCFSLSLTVSNAVRIAKYFTLIFSILYYCSIVYKQMTRCFIVTIFYCFQFIFRIMSTQPRSKSLLNEQKIGHDTKFDLESYSVVNAF